ncbi:MAG TPA: restriction endonuclease subunit S, partial [Anaerolineaceae bacterium]|nr:restriction endonuclease subunit S [Anaerolineaceae bacterium]
MVSQEGDVLVPSTTTADANGIAVARALNQDGVLLGGDINVIRTRNRHILGSFLSYIINFPPLKNVLATFAKGTNIIHLSNNDLRKLEIPLPPLEVQQEIVAEIEGYQKVIDGARMVVENYKPVIPIDPSWPLVKLGEIADYINGFAFKPEDWHGTGTEIIRIQNLTGTSSTINKTMRDD